jgi:hypothetical protein
MCYEALHNWPRERVTCIRFDKWLVAMPVHSLDYRRLESRRRPCPSFKVYSSNAKSLVSWNVNNWDILQCDLAIDRLNAVFHISIHITRLLTDVQDISSRTGQGKVCEVANFIVQLLRAQ